MLIQPVSQTSRGRFAPSTTGQAHPGTLLAALLAWLDARSRDAEFILRFEDLDPARCRLEFRSAIEQSLRWLGLDWEQTHVQSEHFAAHEQALDTLAEAGLLYPCSCSRAAIQAHGLPAADGGYAYPNTCQANPLPQGGWRATSLPLRMRLADCFIVPQCFATEIGSSRDVDNLRQNPSTSMGDPVVRRRDGAIAYQLAVVVDDAHAGITHVVRGRDIAPSTATQVAIYQALAKPAPSYQHHFLLLEERGKKLAKMHGSVGASALQQVYSGAEMCGLLASFIGLIPQPKALLPRNLVGEFSFNKVRTEDLLVHWSGKTLRAQTFEDCSGN